MYYGVLCDWCRDIFSKSTYITENIMINTTGLQCYKNSFSIVVPTNPKLSEILHSKVGYDYIVDGLGRKGKNFGKISETFTNNGGHCPPSVATRPDGNPLLIDTSKHVTRPILLLLFRWIQSIWQT
uniref:Uncharacterized protein n=1 Tax=Phlegmariurus squarrosus TaxID=73615 RepID=H9M829_PHLSQ|nr:hypothetical protein HusqMp18 [Phlegmariurus squarrosus]AEV55736.1 hypothetical protein HusqMp18 [Phlegmariurus squarrosus]